MPDDGRALNPLDPTITQPHEHLGETIGSVDAARETSISFDGDHQDASQSLPSTIPECEDAGTAAQRFGDYAIEGELARGGMGVVFKAKQVSLNRPVALKMILASQLASEDEVQRFYLEAEAAAKLNHPGIVPIYEVGEHDGQHFFSMGLVERGSLADLVKDGPVAPRRAAELMRSIAGAVQYAHARNIVHRDLKPANILLDVDGQPKVTDFGLAKIVEADSGLTATGQVMGTPSYMPPEQARGEMQQVGPLSDVYSLGAILYFLLTGNPPFGGANVMETLKQVLEQEPPSLRRANAEVDLDLETICLKCLRKEPEKRYASAAELADELGRYLNREPITARPIDRLERSLKWIRRNKGLSTGIATAVLALVAGTGVATWQAILAIEQSNKAEAAGALASQEKSKAVMERKKAVAEARKANVARTKAVQESQRADRQRLEAETAKYAMQLKLADIHYENFELPEAHKLLAETKPALRNWEYELVKHRCDERMKSFGKARTYLAAAITPDGQLVAGGGNGGIIDLFDYDTEKRVAELNVNGSFVLQLAFSPDGRRLACATEITICVWDVATRKLLGKLEFSPPPMPKRPTNTLGRFARMIAFDASGKRLAIGLEEEIQIWDATLSKKHRTINTGPGRLRAMAFDPVRDRIAVRRRPPEPMQERPGAVPPDTMLIYNAGSGELQAQVVINSGNLPAIRYDPRGRWLFTTGVFGGSGLAAWDPETGKAIESSLNEFKRPDPGGFDLAQVVFDAKGNRVALAPFMSSSLFMVDVETGALLRTLQMPVSTVNGVRNGLITAVGMSADGRRVVAATSHMFSLGVGRSDVGRLVGVAIDGDSHVIDLDSKGRGQTWHWRDATISEKAGWIARSISYPKNTIGQSINYDMTNQSQNHFLVEFHSLETGELLFCLRRHDRGFGKLLASRDGRSLFEFHGSTIEVWDPRTRRRKLILRLENPEEEVQDKPLLGPDDRLLATVEGDKNADRNKRRYRLVMRDVRAGKILWKTEATSDELEIRAFNSDGSRLLISSKPEFTPTRDPKTGSPIIDHKFRLRIYDTRNGNQIAETKERFKTLGSAKFGNQGHVLLSTWLALKSWNTTTGELTKVSDHAGSFEVVRDGTRLIMANRSMLRVFDVKTMQEVYQMPNSRSGSFHIDPSGNTIVIDGSGVGTPKLLRVTPSRVPKSPVGTR